MRLSSKRMILAYLGKRVDSLSAWLAVRERYGSVIYRDRTAVWSTSEELDALDRSRHPRLTEDGTDLALATRQRLRRVRALGFRATVRKGAEG